MKAIQESFGLESLLTFVVPGLVATAGAYLLLNLGPNETSQLVDRAEDLEAISLLVATGVVLLLGALMASVHAGIETWILDRITPKRLGIPRTTYLAEWNRYLERLSAGSNPYVSRVVLFFQFETRLALAGLVMAVGLVGRSTWASIAAFATSGFLYFMGMVHHVELGQYRHDHHGDGVAS